MSEDKNLNIELTKRFLCHLIDEIDKETNPWCKLFLATLAKKVIEDGSDNKQKDKDE